MRTLIRITLVFYVFIFQNSTFAQHSSNSLEQIEETGKIRIGYRESEPPMSFLNADEKPVGYSIDICKKIVSNLKNKINKPDLEVVYIPVNAHDRFTALLDNKIDILCGSTTKTISRNESVDFTQLTFVTGASIMTLKGQEFDDFAQLGDAKVGVVEDTTTLKHLEKILKKSFSLANIQQFESAEKALVALKNGDIAAFSSDQVVLIGLALSSNEGAIFSISPNVFSYEPFALALRRNDADLMLIANSTISDLSRNKGILKLYDKWFGPFSEKRPPLIEALYQLNAIPE